jgi:hypothetical protein
VAVALVASHPMADGRPGALVAIAVDPAVAGASRLGGLALHWSGAADIYGSWDPLPQGWVTDPGVTWDAGGWRQGRGRGVRGGGAGGGGAAHRRARGGCWDVLGRLEGGCWGLLPPHWPLRRQACSGIRSALADAAPAAPAAGSGAWETTFEHHVSTLDRSRSAYTVLLHLPLQGVFAKGGQRLRPAA